MGWLVELFARFLGAAVEMVTLAGIVAACLVLGVLVVLRRARDRPRH